MTSQLLLLWLIILQGNIHITYSILNGKPSIGDDFRYVVLVYHPEYSCAGVIISAWHILTAGICAAQGPSDEYTITTTSGNSKNVCGPETKSHRVKEIHMADLKFSFLNDSDPTSIIAENNIAVLLLEFPLCFEKNLEVILLPTTDIVSYMFCEIAGWGRTNLNSTQMSPFLKWSDAVTLSPSMCRIYKAPHKENEFCAIDPNEQSAPTKGDHGGGLVCDGILVGIMSDTLEDPATPTVYVKVYSLLSFIGEVMAADRSYTEAILTPACA